MAAAGWMIVTGAGAGIMEAGHVGAGRDASLGLNILLPFEQSANPVMTGNDKLMTMRRDIMGDFTLPRPLWVMGWLSTAAMACAVAAMFATSWG